jgi:arylsulfatase A
MLWEQRESSRDEMYYWRGSHLLAVRKGPWKIHFSTLTDPYTRHAVWERPEIPFLYNVEEDFSEQYEVSEKHPEIVKELVELAEKHKAEMKIKASVCDFGR